MRTRRNEGLAGNSPLACQADAYGEYVGIQAGQHYESIHELTRTLIIHRRLCNRRKSRFGRHIEPQYMARFSMMHPIFP